MKSSIGIDGFVKSKCISEVIIFTSKAHKIHFILSYNWIDGQLCTVSFDQISYLILPYLYYCRPFPQLEHDEIRVLVFKDCDRKGKTLLFDSKAVIKDLNQQVIC